ncbi:hypothetical protein Agabi119p4_4349 [Agaricus bisporus var. burnettii]|uniref:Uncharacterized protein n=1 Tax=Agaricus bisporus var. burnettii TaxID=192524 RepID=A0A8H7F353_AGABI|nr:hypothetical protein Agabi119p4_4349 [Agaricus bisporus var. burnettii]
MTTRSTKRATNEVPQLSHIEALLIAQGVWELGINSSTWSAIAKILAKHPLVTRPKSFFTAQSCHAMYNHLLQQAGLEATEENNAPKAAANLALAEKHYKLRFDELRELIIAEETAFKTILNEIADIKAGNWDAQIKANLTGQAVKSGGSPPVDVQPAAQVESRGDESSDLSGVTETPSSIDESDTLTAKLTSINVAVPSTRASVNDASPPVQSLSAEDEAIEVEVTEDKHSDEIASKSSAAKQPSELVMHDALAPANVNGNDQLRREEEEEEEDATTNKPEEEETDHEDGKAESDAEQDTQPPVTSSIEHRPEEEEEEEEKKEISEKDEEIEVEENLPSESEKHSSRTSSEEQEEQSQREPEKGDAEEPDQEDQDTMQKLEQPVEGLVSDEEPVPTTRRSTRNKSLMPSVPATRKTRRQLRMLESEAQSPILTEGENLDADDIKVYTPEEYQASSPVPAEPMGLRRRKRKASVVAEPVGSPRDRKRLRDESEPVEDDEPGPSYGRNRRRGDRSEEQVALKKFQNVIAGHFPHDMMHESEGYINAFRQTEGLVRGRP